MKKSFSALAFFLVGVVLSSVPFVAQAADTSYDLSAKNANLGFNLDTTLHMVHGVATEFSGKITKTVSKEGTYFTAAVTLPVMKLETGDDKRNEKMKNYAMEADKYPLISFESSNFRKFPASVKRGASFRFFLDGKLTIKDVSKPISILTTVSPTKNPDIAHLDGLVSILWEEFHVNDPSILILSVDKSLVLKYDFDLPYSFLATDK